MIEVQRGQVLGRDLVEHRLVRGRERGLELHGDGAGNLRLDGEDVLGSQLPVIGLRPEMLVGGPVDELDVDADAIGGALHPPLEDGSDSQLGGDLPDVPGGAPILLHRCPRGHTECPDPAELRQDVVVNPVHEARLVHHPPGFEGEDRHCESIGRGRSGRVGAVQEESDAEACHHQRAGGQQGRGGKPAPRGILGSLSGALDSIGGDVEGPRQRQGDRKPENRHDRHPGDQDVGEAERRHEHVRNLHDRPHHGQVDHSHAHDLSALQLLEKNRALEHATGAPSTGRMGTIPAPAVAVFGRWERRRHVYVRTGALAIPVDPGQ